MALNESIDDHATGTYTVTRRARATYDDHGRPVAGATSSLPIVASVQPFGENIKDLPEGLTSEDSRLVLTETELKSPRSDTHEPDDILIDGQMYRIVKVEKYDHWGETHYEATAAMYEEQA